MASLEEVRLLFFGTFFHENNELTADLVQLKQPAQVTEIRVIPLGATVDLSTGAFQLGATNPSEFDIEFYYNDLQSPSKTTFQLLRKFDFNDKTRIQLVCDPAEEIVTDGLLVRGIYSTVTLAVYGQCVDKVHIKEVPEEVKKVEADEPLKEGVEDDDIVPVGDDSPLPDDSPEPESTAVAGASSSLGAETEELAELQLDKKEVTSSSSPTKANSNVDVTSSVSISPEKRDKSEEDPNRAEDQLGESSDYEMEMCEGGKKGPEEQMDTEEISDGEVFASDDEDMGGAKKSKGDQKAETRDEVVKKPMIVDPLIEEVEPISSPPVDLLSDVDDSLVDEFQEPGFEEIISDEEIDFPDYTDYNGEWEENWASKFTKSFNPFSSSFEVAQLENIKLGVKESLIDYRKVQRQSIEMLKKKCKKWHNTPEIGSEQWIEDIEELLMTIPNVSEMNLRDLTDTLRLWVQVGLDFDLATSQPSLPYKTRHLKAGIRLVQWLANLDNDAQGLHPFFMESKGIGTEELAANCYPSIQQRLIELLRKPNMSNTTKLLILRTLDALVSTLQGLESFVSSSTSTGQSCYESLIETSLETSFSTRMSFSLRSLLHKIQLISDLGKVEKIVFKNDKSDYDITSISQLLETLALTAQHVDQYFTHPVRVLPAKTVVEISQNNSSGHDPRLSFVRMLRETKFLTLATALATSDVNQFLGPIVQILKILLNWEHGLVYLCNEAANTTSLLKPLLQRDDDITGVACLVAYCLRVVKCVDVLNSEIPSFDEEAGDVPHLQVVYSFLNTRVGRKALLKTIPQGNFILPILECICPHKSNLRYIRMSDSDKTARRGYAVEILDHVIRTSGSSDFIEKHAEKILGMISECENIEGCEKLFNIRSFLKPALNRSFFSLDGIPLVCEMIKSKRIDMSQSCRTAENNWGFPAEMVTCFRILCSMVTGPETNDVSKTLLSGTEEELVRELKYDLAIVKLHSLDMIPTMIGVLQNIVDAMSFPAMFSHILVSSEGEAMLSLASPLMKTLKKTVTQVVHVRQTEFRDTTAVPVLLKLYRLMDCFPDASLNYSKSREISSNIIEILLSFTIPAVKQGVETEEELNKSTWTAVVGEIIKFTLEEPANFQPGLTLLSEMLPLPFPLATKEKLSEEVGVEAVKLRRLWCAYIHSLSPQIQEMIGLFCTSANVKLLNLLKRVCVQLADMSSATCLAVCRGILDMYSQTLESEADSPVVAPDSGVAHSSIKAWVDKANKSSEENQCSSQTSRVLGFLASLLNNCAAVKCGVSQALKCSTKLDEKYCDILNSMSSILVSRPPSPSVPHLQGQDNIVNIFQALCDVEINMLTPMFGLSKKCFEPEYILANALPFKEHLLVITSTFTNYLNMVEPKGHTLQILEGVLRSLEIICETEQGFNVMSMEFRKQPGLLSVIMKSILSRNDLANQDVFEMVYPCLISYTDFLKTLLSTRTLGNFPPRSTFMSVAELRTLLGWTSVDDGNESSLPEKTGERSLHPICKLREKVTALCDRCREEQLTFNTLDASELESLVDNVNLIISKVVLSSDSKEETIPALKDVKFPPGDPLTELFNVRPLYVIIENEASNDNMPLFWMTAMPPAFELDSETDDTELVVCDLEDLAKTYLTGFDVSSEIQNISKNYTKSRSNAKEESSNKNKIPNMDQSNQPSGGLLQFQRRFPGSLHRGNRGMFSRGGGGSGGRGMYDPFRSRPPNTSRPPSLHVDDFVALGSTTVQPRGEQQYSPRGRGSRGQPFNMSDRGNNRRSLNIRSNSQQGPSPYYQGRKPDGPNIQQRLGRGGGGPGGRVYSTPTSDRWTADMRGSPAPHNTYDRYPPRPPPGNYEDNKYRYSPSSSRSGGGGGTPSPRHASSNSPYPPRTSSYNNSNRDSRTSTGSQSSARWKERQNTKSFNR